MIQKFSLKISSQFSYQPLFPLFLKDFELTFSLIADMSNVTVAAYYEYIVAISFAIPKLT